MKMLLLCLFALPAQAQQVRSVPARPPVVRTAVVRESFDANTPPEQRASKHTQLLRQQLSLTPAQEKRVYAAELTLAQGYQTLLRRNDTLPLADSRFRSEKAAIEQRFEASLAAICTPVQNQQHQATLAAGRRLRARYHLPD